MKIQSYIDIITNSSTTVFTFADNIEGVKRIINGVLKASGSEYTCDDLFEITTEWEENAFSDYEEYQIEEAEEHIKENPELKKLFAEYEAEYHKEYTERDWNFIKNIEKSIMNIVSENSNAWNIVPLDAWVQNCNDGWECKYSSNYVIIPKDPKNQEAANMISTVNNLFDYDASYC